MRIVETTLYKLWELSPKAKEKAITNYMGINVDWEWWDSIYDDAKAIGLKITGFDIDRGSYVEGEFIGDPTTCADLIIKNHGENCDTYETAENFLKERDSIVDSAPKTEDGEFEDEYTLDCDLDECENDFLKALRECYLSQLRNEYDYLTSEESIKETLELNEYDFTEDGKIWPCC